MQEQALPRTWFAMLSFEDIKHSMSVERENKLRATVFLRKEFDGCLQLKRVSPVRASF
jgi:hypothetical protein